MVKCLLAKVSGPILEAVKILEQKNDLIPESLAFRSPFIEFGQLNEYFKLLLARQLLGPQIDPAFLCEKALVIVPAVIQNTYEETAGKDIVNAD